MILSILTYTYIIVSSFFWDELKNSWDTNGNVTCLWNPGGVKMGLYPATALAEFQVLRKVRTNVDFHIHIIILTNIATYNMMSIYLIGS